MWPMKGRAMSPGEALTLPGSLTRYLSRQSTDFVRLHSPMPSTSPMRSSVTDSDSESDSLPVSSQCRIRRYGRSGAIDSGVPADASQLCT